MNWGIFVSFHESQFAKIRKEMVGYGFSLESVEFSRVEREIVSTSKHGN